jgi:hypothetical protein
MMDRLNFLGTGTFQNRHIKVVYTHAIQVYIIGITTVIHVLQAISIIKRSVECKVAPEGLSG